MSALRRYFISQWDGSSEKICLDGDEFKHLKVLRPRIGEMIELVNGCGDLFLTEIIQLEPDQAYLQIKNHSYEDKPMTTFALAYPYSRMSKLDDIIAPLSEVGVHEVIPYLSERTVNQHKVNFLRERLVKKSMMSMKQCKRLHMMTIKEVHPWKQLLEISSDYDLCAFAHPDQPHVFNSSKQILNQKKILIVIGPEGGFSVHEIRDLESKKYFSFSLGSNILKMETASVVLSWTISQWINEGAQ